MLTACAMQSQDTISDDGRPATFDTLRMPSLNTPISFPFWMVKAIALDLEEKERLEEETQILALEVETYRKLLASLEQKDRQRILQLGLLEKNLNLVQEQLRAERQSTKPDRTLTWLLRLLGALGAGFLLGRF